jgi:hypothetical protein
MIIIEAWIVNKNINYLLGTVLCAKRPVTAFLWAFHDYNFKKLGWELSTYWEEEIISNAEENSHILAQCAKTVTYWLNALKFLAIWIN